MPDAKLTELPSNTTANSNDLLYVASSSLSKKITVENFLNTLPHVTTTTNVNVSGNISIPGGQKVLYGGEDYAETYVYETIESLFTPNTGHGLVSQSTSYTVQSAVGHNTVMLSAVSGHQSFSYGDRLRVTVPHIGNYAGYTISFIQGGTAWIEFVPSTNVTVNSYNSSLTASGQWGKVDLTYIGNDEYVLTGNLSAAS